MPLTKLIQDLEAAETEDRVATRAALDLGLKARQPLSLADLGRLCALGEKMQGTSARRQEAQDRLQRASIPIL